LTTIIVTHDPRIAEQVDRVVAIRDGKISTETVRQVSQLEKIMAGDRPTEGHETPLKEEVTYHEFVILDSAGRLQIPKELREQLGIGRRAQLDKVDDGILIRPVETESETAGKHLSLEEQIALLFEAEASPPQKPRSQKRLRLPGRK